MTFVKSKLFRKKNLIFIIPAVLLIVLLIAAAPGAIYREHHYRGAVKALNAGDLVTAQEMFEDIPMYRDSETLLQNEIPYLRAGKLMEAAVAEDEAALEETVYTVYDVNEDTTVSMLLYQAAENQYLALSNYKDSAALAETCRSNIDTEKELLRQQAEEAIRQQNQSAYEQASSLLYDGAYSEAASAFEALGDYQDSASMVKECRYRKAVSIFQFLSSYDVSRIYASISTQPAETSIFSFSAAEALRLGSSCVDELRSACGKDRTDIRLEEQPGEQLLPLKDALSDLFVSLGDYADSPSYISRIEDETDYTRDFFMLCSTGELYAAQDWLRNFDGDFPDRDRWNWLLETYLPYCGQWDLYLGDSSLLSYTIGQSFTAMSVSTRVIMTRESAILRLNFGDGYGYSFDLPTELGETLFINTEMDNGFYMAALNNGHFVYMRYDQDWHILSSCDFIPA